jgi:hypothetical protein
MYDVSMTQDRLDLGFGCARPFSIEKGKARCPLILHSYDTEIFAALLSLEVLSFISTGLVVAFSGLSFSFEVVGLSITLL